MKEIIFISVSGDESLELTPKVVNILASHEAHILDIGQSETLAVCSLGILVELPGGDASPQLIKEVLFEGHKLGLTVRCVPISPPDYERWVNEQGKARYIVTLLARKISSQQLASVTDTIARHGLKVDNLTRLSGRIPLGADHANRQACIEMSVRGRLDDLSKIKADFLSVASEQGIDVAFQEDNIFRRNRRLVVFDMDSTLIEAEVIDELAKRAGAGDAVSEITERAMAGELDFKQSFEQRVALLRGLDESVLADIAESLPLMEGAEKLVTNLKEIGYKTAILSGGFTYFGQYLKKKLGIDYVYANELVIENGRVTGQVKEPVVDGRRKAELLSHIAKQEGIRLEQVIAVGDGANDLPMLELAGLGIAFRAKPLVRQSAEHAISNLGLDGILYLIGFRDHDVNQSA